MKHFWVRVLATSIEVGPFVDRGNAELAAIELVRQGHLRVTIFEEEVK